MSIRIVWLLLAALAAASSTLAELSDRQLRTLDGITRDRFTGRWVDLGTNELKALRTRADAYVGQTFLGKYRVRKFLGEGSNAHVFLASSTADPKSHDYYLLSCEI